ncbi:MAG: hypothetical protein RLZZ326_2342 [Planctomycetota bacterium]
MAEANVRRRGTGDPEATFESRIGEAQRASYLWATRRRGRQKFRRSSEAPRHSSSVRRSPPRLRVGKEAQCAILDATARGRPKPRLRSYRASPESLVPVGDTSAGPAKVSSFLGGPRHSSSVRRSPPRLRAGGEAQCATLSAASEWSPVLGEPASQRAHATRRGHPRSSRERGSSSGRADRRRPSRIPSVARGPRSRQTPPAARSERLGANRASAGDTARG